MWISERGTVPSAPAPSAVVLKLRADAAALDRAYPYLSHEAQIECRAAALALRFASATVEMDGVVQGGMTCT